MKRGILGVKIGIFVKGETEVESFVCLSSA